MCLVKYNTLREVHWPTAVIYVYESLMFLIIICPVDNDNGLHEPKCHNVMSLSSIRAFVHHQHFIYFILLSTGLYAHDFT